MIICYTVFRIKYNKNRPKYKQFIHILVRYEEKLIKAKYFYTILSILCNFIFFTKSYSVVFNAMILWKQYKIIIIIE